MRPFPFHLPTVPAGLLVEAVAVEPTRVVITAHAAATNVACPACGVVTRRVHSRYRRTLADLPWQGREVSWRVWVRRFRCVSCDGRVFAEGLPGSAARKGRRTGRLARAQTGIGFATGGEPGARLSCRLAMPVSGDTVLRLIRRRGTVPSPPPRVIGIDDWAWRRGQRYGTIVCDLERGQVIDLLPDRNAEAAAVLDERLSRRSSPLDARRRAAVVAGVPAGR